MNIKQLEDTLELIQEQLFLLDKILQTTSSPRDAALIDRKVTESFATLYQYLDLLENLLLKSYETHLKDSYSHLVPAFFYPLLNAKIVLSYRYWAFMPPLRSPNQPKEEKN